VTAQGGLESADYSAAERHCDVVMKGGITSGVVYPLAVCELARHYRFTCVGGTSAGAIAAAATAAAEYGREKGGFRRLAQLPRELGSEGRLMGLFQPEDSTRRPFEVMIGALEGRFWGALRAALRCNSVTALLGSALGVALLVLSLIHWHDQGFDALTVLGGVCGVIVVLVGVALAVGLRLTHIVARHIPDNGFGMCSGTRPDPDGQPGLTPWLAGLLEECAGRSGADPLTFGDLWAGPGSDADPRNPPEPGKRFVELEMMTTNLVNRVGKRIPWDDSGWYFDPDEFRALFPEQVVRWMEAHPPRAGSQRSELHRVQMLPRLPLPEAKDLPVVVAARMSLSFPVLLSAVPLWSFDFTRPQTAEREEEWRIWLKARGKDWRVPCGRPEEWPYEAVPTSPEGERCWFSDGGITSNFPIHFFDTLVPGRPTFGIDLRPFPFERKADKKDQSKNVSIAKHNNDGNRLWWYRLPTRPARRLLRDGRLPGFLGAAVKTMQNRVDEGQMRAPGYRDRVAHVELTDDEGGMNLNMKRPKIERLSERGRDAAAFLAEAFQADPATQTITWDNHRWIRLRSAFAALEQMHVEFAEGFDGGAPDIERGWRSYRELLDRGEDVAPTSYKMESTDERNRAKREVTALRDLGTGPDAEELVPGAPKPTTVGRIVPKE
jgi:predicted acylesterase/phospholipase RssA